ncbi:hypothetical protein PTKIN_Ptkin04bG0216600 [Pterospermum kingtungense]
MESKETAMSGQANQGTSVSALMDAIALQEQMFEQSLASQQLWSQQFANAQEEKIKEAVQKTSVFATEVNEIRKGKTSGVSGVKTEEFSSGRVFKELEPQLQPPSPKFSRSKSKSTSLPRYPEVYKDHRRDSPDHVNKRDRDKFGSYTRYDHHKDQDPEVYKDHGRYSPDHVSKRDLDKFNSFTPHDHHKDRRGSSRRENKRSHAYRRSPSIERSWKRERRSPSESRHQRYCHDNSRSPRSGSFRCQSSDRRDRNYRRASRSPVDDSIPHHRRSIDSRKKRERRGASPFEIGKRHRSRDTLAEDDHNNYRRDHRDKMSTEPTGTRSRYESKQTLHGNMARSKIDHRPTDKVGNGPERMTE